MKPNLIGSKVLYFNPGITNHTSADLAAEDSAMSESAIYPYCHTATVGNHYDSQVHTFDTAGSVLVAGQQNAFGLFLSPDNDLKNLIFQVSGKVNIHGIGTGYEGLMGSFFFGRKATDNTVVSSKAGANNLLAKFIYLGPSYTNSISTPTSFNLSDEVCTEVFGQELTGGYVWCFGYVIRAYDNTGNITLQGNISLSIRKYVETLPTYRVKGS